MKIIVTTNELRRIRRIHFDPLVVAIVRKWEDSDDALNVAEAFPIQVGVRLSQR